MNFINKLILLCCIFSISVFCSESKVILKPLIPALSNRVSASFDNHLFSTSTMTINLEGESFMNSDGKNKIKLSASSQTVLKNLLGVWGVIQVVCVLSNAIKRLYPIAVQPIIQKDMSPVHWVMYVIWILYMAYAEGYKAFQLKFAPLVVARAFSLFRNPSIINYLLAGPYSMGLFGASRKRMIISWAITSGVFSLVIIVKMLPYPYRSIVDAGVVVGLSYGTLSILALTVKALMGGTVAEPPDATSPDVFNKAT